MTTAEISQETPTRRAVPPEETCACEGYSPTLPQRTSPCRTFRIFSLTPATRTLVLRGTFVLVSKILSVGTLEATRHVLTSLLQQPPAAPKAQTQLLLPPKAHSSQAPKIRSAVSLKKKVKQVLKCWLGSGLFLLDPTTVPVL